jgi:hypothetical protein
MAGAVRHLGDHLDVLFKGKERDQGLAENAHVLRHQDADDRPPARHPLTHDINLGRQPRRR